ncbi:MAG TPA: zf-TFIIB domain-containing protein [Chloroflexota bacterium]|nr:zf-TFIIB domain-containing protein [Chloroflexota bacterium]
MLCPHCKVPLTITDRQGIEIDFCPNCRGVWLDRGELDKILDRSATMMPAQGAQPGYPPPAPGYAPQPQGGWRRHDDDDDDDDRRRYYGQPGYGQHGYPPQGYRRKRESWLGDLFDFD